MICAVNIGLQDCLKWFWGRRCCFSWVFGEVNLSGIWTILLDFMSSHCLLVLTLQGLCFGLQCLGGSFLNQHLLVIGVWALQEGHQITEEVQPLQIIIWIQWGSRSWFVLTPLMIYFFTFWQLGLVELLLWIRAFWSHLWVSRSGAVVKVGYVGLLGASTHQIRVQIRPNLLGGLYFFALLLKIN